MHSFIIKDPVGPTYSQIDDTNLIALNPFELVLKIIPIVSLLLKFSKINNNYILENKSFVKSLRNKNSPFYDRKIPRSIYER